MGMISKNYDVRSFVPKEVYSQYGETSSQFVSDNIVRMFEFIHMFFNNHYKKEDSNIEKVVIVVNNWWDQALIKICGQTFNWRGLRTYSYIDSLVEANKPVAKLSQHIGGSTNAGDFNVILYFKGGKALIVNSDTIYDIILKNEKVFMEAGLTTLENKSMTKGWTHADCRFTGKQNIYIVNL